MKRLLIIAFLLAGCTGEGSGKDYCKATYGYPDTVFGDTGLVLEGSPAVLFVSFQEMETIYTNVEMCVVNNTTPGPVVQFRSFTHAGLGGGWGVYAAATQLIVMNTDIDFNVRNCFSDRQTLKHEFVHHILYMNGQEWGHSNDAFTRCDAVGVKTCNGIPCE